MALTKGDKAWIRKAVREILAEVIAQEARHGGYDGATDVTEDWVEEGKRRRRIGFKLPKK